MAKTLCLDCGIIFKTVKEYWMHDCKESHRREH